MTLLRSAVKWLSGSIRQRMRTTREPDDSTQRLTYRLARHRLSPVAGRLLCGGGKPAYISCMSAGQAVLLVGVSLVIIALMIRFERVQHRRIERRREAWKAAGGVDPYPDDYMGGGFTSPLLTQIPRSSQYYPPLEGGHMKDLEDDRPLLDRRTTWRITDQYRGDESTDMAGFSDREEEEFLLIYGPRKVRKAIKERRKAREQAKKQSN